MQRNELCWCGSGKKWKKCHYPAALSSPPAQNSLAKQYYKQYQILLKTPEQIVAIRQACQLASDILAQTCARAKPGVTTLELNDFAHALHLKAGAIPAPLHYGDPPFPKSICTSLNEVICHGIPDKTVLKTGDILNIDVTTLLNGYYGDCSRMVVVGGQTTPERQHVVDVCLEALKRSLALLKPGMLIREIGEVITAYAHAQHCSVVDQFVGHGVGVGFHEPPQIPYHRNNVRIPLAPGMTFTIEPMINAGGVEALIDPHDHWTARTADGKPSAQWEHTVLITETGYELLTSFEP